MKFFLGIDGGQSSTTALIGDENGRVIGIGRAGPCNHARRAEGRDKFLRAISDSIRAAGGDHFFECACLGLSGGPADKEALARETIRAKRFIFTHDAAIALSGALAGEPGIVVIAGTGSIAYGKNWRGVTARAGGWGYIFGDEGGAFDLVRQALRASLRYEEGWGPPTGLRAALLASTGAANANELLHLFYSEEFPRSRIASLASIVDEAARAGDAIAREILHTAAQSLATLAAAVRAQLFSAEEPARISYSGGVFQSAPLLQRFAAMIDPAGCELVAPKHGPAAGALIEAYRGAGIKAEIAGPVREKI
ncbi:MAG TPA: BadF/BadG/BcrA/BcrD ATPase family protein [Bryobacteraceae bacterium]|jgi:N-acetylglucosamine kinase-like BadF-type ATPase|nr:BadF/BadG/BcrA/BcrD ATPase family protein [Bryobacteraceae bacterium]